MKRLLILIVAIVAVPAAGFMAGTQGVDAWRQWLRQDPVRTGDFRFVVDPVGSPVVLLSTTTCPWCEKTRQWLARAGVAYRDCLVDSDTFARGLLDRLQVETVPQLVSATAAVSGYDESLFRQLVDAAEPPPGGRTPPTMRCEPPRVANQPAPDTAS